MQGYDGDRNSYPEDYTSCPTCRQTIHKNHRLSLPAHEDLTHLPLWVCSRCQTTQPTEELDSLNRTILDRAKRLGHPMPQIVGKEKEAQEYWDKYAPANHAIFQTPDGYFMDPIADGRRPTAKPTSYPTFGQQWPTYQHPLTCNKCNWGRSPENFSEDEFHRHMDTKHQLYAPFRKGTYK